jgi:4'-phosphopantetheinyl transferase
MLPEGEVHVWLVPVARGPEPIALLDDEERDRAGRFRVDAARKRFVVSRAALRLVLGRIAGMAPESLRFVRRCGHCGSTGHGKPYLSGGSGLDFSLAHSGDLALIAVARGRRVGADVERVRTRTDVLAVAGGGFSLAERLEIESQPTDCERREAFFRCWTRKEAYLKALGVGLAGGLDGMADPARWEVRSLAAPPGYTAAVAAEGQFALRQRTTLCPPNPKLFERPTAPRPSPVRAPSRRAPSTT